jgi:hypothetical protein
MNEVWICDRLGSYPKDGSDKFLRNHLHDYTVSQLRRQQITCLKVSKIRKSVVVDKSKKVAVSTLHKTWIFFRLVSKQVYK